jgi:hypothetical protein
VARAQWLIAAGKSKAARRVLRLRPEARGIMEHRSISAGTEGFLFRGRKQGTALSDRENSHKRVLEASGLAFAIYDFRHTGRCGFGVDPGPADLRTVMWYVHVSQEHLRRQMHGHDQAEEIRVKSGSNDGLEAH